MNARCTMPSVAWPIILKGENISSVDLYAESTLKRVLGVIIGPILLVGDELG